jgi:hypothetical protein
MKKTLILFSSFLVFVAPLKASHVEPFPDPQPGLVPTPCQPADPSCYPSAPSHGTDCALTFATLALPIILVVGVAAIILSVSDSNNTSH